MSEQKKRHGCFSLWLILVFLVTIMGLAGSVYLLSLGNEALEPIDPTIAYWMGSIGIVLSLFGLVCVVALFRWKKWGFWGFCLLALLEIGVTILLPVPTSQASGPLMGIVLLYAALQMGDDNEGWSQLE